LEGWWGRITENGKLSSVPAFMASISPKSGEERVVYVTEKVLEHAVRHYAVV
jgi:hypothetical protein